MGRPSGGPGLSWALLDRSRRLLSRSWAVLGWSCAVWKRSWSGLEGSFGTLGLLLAALDVISSFPGVHVRACFSRYFRHVCVLCALLGGLVASWGFLVCFEAILARSWGVPGLSWATLGRSWPLLSRSWLLLGSSWAGLGAVLGRLGVVLGRSWCGLGRSWSHPRLISMPQRHPRGRERRPRAPKMPEKGSQM